LRRLSVFVVFLLLSAAAAIFGAQFEPGAWHAALAKPDWHPPNALFGPVWTVLYVLIAIAGWRAWFTDGPRRQVLLALWAAQLLLNAAWSWLFFGLRLPWLAFADIVLLLAAIVGFIAVGWKPQRIGALLFLPYAAWVAFAAALNASLAVMN
jgi:translocator protein